VSNEELLKQFVSRLPGSVQGRPFISRDYLKEIIFRWKSLRKSEVTYKEFLNLMKIPNNGVSERGFRIIAAQENAIEITQLVLALGAFVAAPTDERVDFACRLLDESAAGFLNEGDITKILNCNFVGVKADLKTRRERIMRESDSNGLLTRKQLTGLAKNDPGLFFPPSRME
jgi:Ca2+-binding EF-hand superfamily protein